MTLSGLIKRNYNAARAANLLIIVTENAKWLHTVIIKKNVNAWNVVKALFQAGRRALLHELFSKGRTNMNPIYISQKNFRSVDSVIS